MIQFQSKREFQSIRKTNLNLLPKITSAIITLHWSGDWQRPIFTTFIPKMYFYTICWLQLTLLYDTQKVVKRVNLNITRGNVFLSFLLSSFLFYLHEMMGVDWIYHNNHFTTHVNQSIILNALSLYRDEHHFSVKAGLDTLLYYTSSTFLTTE